jgi:hypothetical protein
MPLDTNLSELTVNIQGDAAARLLDNGFIDVLTGPKFKTPDEEITSQVVLVTLSFGKPAFKATVGGVMVSNPISSGIGVSTGDPVQFRAYPEDRRSFVLGGTAGKGKGEDGKGFNMELPAKTIVEGITVGCSGLTHMLRKSMPGI